MLSSYAGEFFLVINATSQEVIQVYDNITPSSSLDFLVKNGHINIVGCYSGNSNY